MSNENEKIICPPCNEENESNDTYCSNCKTRLNYNTNSITTERKRYISVEGEGFITATKWIAILELICSVLMAVDSWSKAGKINEFAYNKLEIANQMKSTLVGVGLAYLLGGIIIFILLMSVHYIGKNVINQLRQMNN